MPRPQARVPVQTRIQAARPQAWILDQSPRHQRHRSSSSRSRLRPQRPRLLIQDGAPLPRRVLAWGRIALMALRHQRLPQGSQEANLGKHPPLILLPRPWARKPPPRKLLQHPAVVVVMTVVETVRVTGAAVVVTSAVERTAEAQTAEVQTAAVRMAEVQTAAVRMAEVQMAEVQLGQGRTALAQMAEVQMAKAQMAEVQMAEVQMAEVTETARARAAAVALVRLEDKL